MRQFVRQSVLGSAARVVFIGGFVGASALAGCGGDDSSVIAMEPPAAAGGDDGAPGDAPSDGDGSGDDGQTVGETPDPSAGTGDDGDDSGISAVFAGPTGAAGVRNLYGLTYSRVGEHAGKLYASGVGESGNVVVLRVNADGGLDTAFGNGGWVDTGAVGNSYGVVELANGELVVQGNGAGQVFLLKLDPSGALDEGFGRVVVLGWDAADVDAIETACAAAAADAENAELATACTTLWPSAVAPAFTPRPSYTSWDIQLDTVTTPGTEKIVVFAFGAPAKAESGQRADDDRWVARVLASDGSPDPAFNAGAPFGVDVAGLERSDGGRRGFIDADGSLVSAGYTDFGEGNNAVLIRLTPDGTPDASFGFDGVADPSTLQSGMTRFNPFVGPGAMAEVYSVVKQPSGRYVTTGYGVSNFNVSTIENDLLSFGVMPNGLDSAWSDEGVSVVQSEVDQSVIEAGTWDGGRAFRENGRDLVLLPDGRTFQVGCYNDYASVFVMAAEGGLDASFGAAGKMVFDTGASVTHTAPFFAVTQSPDGRIATTASGDFLAIFAVQGD